MKKQIFLVVSTMVFLMVTACNSQTPPLPTATRTLTTTNSPTIQPSVTITNTPVPSQTNTPTLTITQTPRPTTTSLPTPSPSPTSSPYPTFELSEINTRAPSPPAQCPPENPELQLSIDVSQINPSTDYSDIIRQAFDEGATIQQVAQEFNPIFAQEFNIQAYFPLLDLTGDGVDELVVYQSFHAIIFGCDNDKYKILLDYSGGLDIPHIATVQDMNLNGIPDVVFEHQITTGGNTVANILEWDGTEFVSLIQANHGENSATTSRLARALYWYEDDFLLANTPVMNNGADGAECKHKADLLFKNVVSKVGTPVEALVS